jgi:hypothetical protein
LLPNFSFAEAKDNLDRMKFNLYGGLNYESGSIADSSPSTRFSGSVATIALKLGSDYFIDPKLALTGSTQLNLMTSIDAEILGLDAGLRYYPWSPGSKSETYVEGSKLETSPGMVYFLHFGYVGKSYQFGSTNLLFQGAELGGGVDYHTSQKQFLRISTDYQRLQNTTSRLLTGFSIGMSYGISL